MTSLCHTDKKKSLKSISFSHLLFYPLFSFAISLLRADLVDTLLSIPPPINFHGLVFTGWFLAGFFSDFHGKIANENSSSHKESGTIKCQQNWHLQSWQLLMANAKQQRQSQCSTYGTSTNYCGNTVAADHDFN
jgi:hypothetical protein